MSSTSSNSNIIFLHAAPQPAKEISDTALVAQGFDAVYRRYMRYVARVGYRLLGRPNEVEDLVQDVFLLVHKRLHQLKDPEALKGWLSTITTRLAIQRLKRRRLKRFIGLDTIPEYVEVEAPGASAEDRALLSQVFVALESLPPMLRVVWSLKYLEGKNNTEISVMCGCSPTTVKRHHAQARQLLTEVFRET